MSKRLFVVLSILVVASVLLAACGTKTEVPPPVTEAPATEAPATEAPTTAYECTDSIGCAVIEPGQTIKIGMGAPMTGDNAAFGQDISQGAKIAVHRCRSIRGFLF